MRRLAIWGIVVIGNAAGIFLPTSQFWFGASCFALGISLPRLIETAAALIGIPPLSLTDID